MNRVQQAQYRRGQDSCEHCDSGDSRFYAGFAVAMVLCFLAAVVIVAVRLFG